jgi:hypothetical protein
MMRRKRKKILEKEEHQLGKMVYYYLYRLPK